MCILTMKTHMTCTVVLYNFSSLSFLSFHEMWIPHNELNNELNLYSLQVSNKVHFDV